LTHLEKCYIRLWEVGTPYLTRSPMRVYNWFATYLLQQCGIKCLLLADLGWAICIQIIIWIGTFCLSGWPVLVWWVPFCITTKHLSELLDVVVLTYYHVPWHHTTLYHYTTPHITPYHTTQHYSTETTPCHTTQHHTTPHHTTPHHTTPHHTTPHHTTPHHTTPHHTTPQHNTTQHNTTQHNTTQRKNGL